jgi:hypothetical protein
MRKRASSARTQKKRKENKKSSTTAPAKKSNVSKLQVECIYDYRDKDWNLLFQVVRLEPKSLRHRGK